MRQELDLDLLIVGGGLQGLSVLHEVGQRSPGAHLLISRDPLGEGETLHSHGYLHRGYTLPAEEAALIPDLMRAFDGWTGWMARQGIHYGERSPILFDLPEERLETMTEAWTAAGLPFERLDRLPQPLEGGVYDNATPHRLVRIHDRLIEPWRIVEAFGRPLQGAMLRGELRRMSCDGAARRITSCEVLSGDRSLILRPRAVVLATGRDTQPLLRSIAPLRTRNLIREVPMVLIEGQSLPELSGWFALDAPLGMMTHTSEDGRRMWVVTPMEGHRSGHEDHVARHVEVDAAVVRKTMALLCRMVPKLRDLAPGLRIASYVGTKVDHPEGSREAYISDAGLTNLRFVWPVLWASTYNASRVLVDELIESSLLTGSPGPPLSLEGTGLTPGVEPGTEHRFSPALQWSGDIPF